MTTRQTITRFLEPVQKKRPVVLHASIHDGITAALLTWFVYFSQYAVAALENNDKELFLQWCINLGVLSIILLLVKIIRKPYIFTFFRDLRNVVDEICMPKLIHWDNNRFESYGTWRIISIYRKWVTTRVDIIGNIFWDLVQSLVLFSAFFYTVAQKWDHFLLIAVLVLCFVFIRFYLLWPKQYIRRRVAKEKSIEWDRLETKRFMSKYEILQQNKIRVELDKRTKIRLERYKAKFKEKIFQWIAFDWAWFFVMVTYAVLVYVIGQKVFNQTLQYSDMIAITGIGVLFIKELDWLLRLIRIVLDRRIDVRKLRDLIDEVSKNKRIIDAWQDIQIQSWDILLQEVEYKYPDGTHVFNNFTIHILAKQKTALVWPSWWGKSTLIKLVAWYLSPDNGEVIIDTQKLSDINLLSYYKHIGYLTQEPSVFDWTIRENLEYGIQDFWKLSQKTSEDWVDHNLQISSDLSSVISLSKCEWIYDLPHGLDTEIGERGIRLSGGQKQRLAIAKIMLKNPDIILLDEPTSALDSANEQAVTEALNNLFKDKTVIIIAHRLQTVKHADDIIYIADGKVLERGTHDELLALWWAYYKMVELQSGF
jgi:ABC-type multidrug transport system fused ATPase/permease subunit